MIDLLQSGSLLQPGSLLQKAILLGAILGAGLVLCASPTLGPRTSAAIVRPTPVQRVADAFAARLVVAGLPPVPFPAVVAISLITGTIAAGAAQAFLALHAVTAGALLAGFLAPTAVVLHRSALVRERNRAVWPDVVDLLVAGIRSGGTLPDTLAALAHTGPQGTREAFSGFAADYSTTSDFSYAIGRTKDRLADPTADRILETLRMAREVGGTELVAVLTGLGRYLRAEETMRSELEARQGWVMNAARLGSVAPWIVLVLLSSRQEAVDAYNSPLGVAVLVVGAVATILAYRIMRTIGMLPRDGRWFA